MCSPLVRHLFAGPLLALASLGAASASATTVSEEQVVAMDEGPMDHITAADREALWRDIDANLARLDLPKAGETPLFRWPLRAARGYSGPGFDRIANFVDHDQAFPDLVRDYSCGTRTYDRPDGYNHEGTDIALWPDPWNAMAAGHTEIVAAAPGIIASRIDGNFDRNCARVLGTTWNVVSIRHADGSIAWYGHMKSGSLTPKAVGQSVVAGEYLGLVGSSGVSTLPHLHFEVFDASRRLIDPFAGQCNAKNADSWWEHQPPYYVTKVNRAFTSSAAPVTWTCGSDARLQDPGTLNEKTAFRRGESVLLVAAVRDMLAGQSVSFTLRAPDGSVYRRLTGNVATGYGSNYRFVTVVFDATAPLGTWLFEASLAGNTASAAFTLSATGTEPANYTDLWWNSAESGWGINVIHQGDILFATWFTYDSDGQGMWLVMPDARLQGDGRYSGTIYRTTGVPLEHINGQPAASFPPPSVGTGSFRFASPGAPVFTYALNGVSQQKAITRQAFSTPATCAFTAGSRASLTNYQDLWWNAAEPGWGINIAHQGETLFVTWFTYGAGGRGQWLVGSDVRRQPTGEFRGRLYKTSGTPFDRIAGAPAVGPGGLADVGQIVLAFSDGENGRMDYSLEGVIQSKALTRQVFASPATFCR